MFYVYVLYSSKINAQYIGMTNDMDRRLAEHNIGKTQSTKRGIPWEIAHYEAFENRALARNRENT
jgi:putative endonuclease